MYDWDRLFTTDQGPDCGSCPKCDCGGRNVGDIWSVEIQEYDDMIQNKARCITCECKNDTYGNHYADCEDGDMFTPGTSYDFTTGSGISMRDCVQRVGDEYQCHYDVSDSPGIILLCEYISCFLHIDYKY